MKIGQKVIRTPETFYDADLKTGHSNKHPLAGVVAYIHPENRYHMVEFKTRGGIIRECFSGVSD